MNLSYFPSLFQANTRVWLTALSQDSGRRATLDDIPDAALDDFKAKGFDWIWFLSVWRTGELGRKVSLENPVWQKEFENTLPDLKNEDIGGSGFAIAGYEVQPELGGAEALKRLRTRLKKRGLKLMLDFVPNHMGPDHPWVQEHPEYFVSGTENDLEQNPQNYTRVKSGKGDLILAYGRDPYFDGWPDTVQLDYSNPATAEAMKQELLRIAGQCDGVRCDMSMLILPEVFEKTWGRKAVSFWPEATNTVRAKSPGFCFMAEVYWDMEFTLQQQGFDNTYDKRLYDRLCEMHARPVRDHLLATPDYQQKSARFLENHDEPRSAATFEPHVHRAAAVITFTIPGLRFFHQGQLEGRKKRISPHLVRGPQEQPDKDLEAFYNQLLAVLRKPVFKNGEWQLLDSSPAWEGNESWTAFIAHEWQGTEGERMLVVVNYAPHASQCYLPIPNLSAGRWRLQDLMSDAVYDRDRNDLLSRGLYLDMPAWHYHIFELTPLKS